MQKMIIAATVLLITQIGLSAAIFIGHKNVGAAPPDTLFLTFSPDDVQSLEIADGKGDKVLLVKDGGGWIMPQHFSAPVDETKLNTLLDKLASLKQGFVVATSDDAAKRFKIDAKSFNNQVVIKGADKTLADFYVGTSPAFRQVHARRNDRVDIVTIAFSAFELETAADKWLDRSLATINNEDLTALEFADFTLQKVHDEWQLAGLPKGETLNQSEIDALITKARSLIVQDVFDPAKVSGFFDHPTFHFMAVNRDGKRVEYAFAKGEDDFYLLKVSDRDFYCKVLVPPVEALQQVKRKQLLTIAAPPEDKAALLQ